MKNSFVMYQMWEPMISTMRTEDAGKLFKAIYAYQTNGITLPESDPLYPVFAMIRTQFEHDNQRYEETCKRNRENANKRWSESESIRNDATAYDGIRTDANYADSDSDSDSEKNKRIKDKDTCAVPSPKTLAPEADVEAIPLNNGSEWKPTSAEYDEFVRLYPAVDIQAEFRKMRGWSISNPAKRKTKNGVKRFVNSWLSREQDKGSKQVPLAAEKPKPKQNAFNSFESQHEYNWDELAKTLSHYPVADTG